jgi:proteasome lid subunit RPN8/RPN11
MFAMITTLDVPNAIRAHGEAAYPEEGCGFLLGTVRDGTNRVHAIRRVTNRETTNRTRRYTITPDDYRAAQQAAAEQDLDIVGFYHSHPDHPPRPSETDLAEATFPGYTYAIVSVRDGSATDLTAWTLAPDRSRFEEEAIRLEEMTPA